MDWATSSARFLLNNHMGPTQPFTTNATFRGSEASPAAPRSATARFLKVDRCDIFARLIGALSCPIRFFFTPIQNDSGFLRRQIAHSMR
jgi:hypothetical protein